MELCAIMVKKQFFREQTKAQIKKKDLARIRGNLVETILDLRPHEFVIISPLVPRGFESARKFMKYGRDVKLRRAYSLDQAIKMNKTPVDLRTEAFNSLGRGYFCGYTFLPLSKDKRTRKVSLIECMEGARIFAYSHQQNVPIKVKPYADAGAVRKEGAEVVAEVPSRREGERRIQLKLISVPFVDSPKKYGIVLGIGSDHSCPSKRFNIRYRYVDDKESSGILNMCAHEIAAYHELIQQEWNENKNLIPLQMCQFAIPSQLGVDYYLKWENNVLVKDRSLKCKDKLRKPNRADKEIGLWMLVRNLKHDKTFFSKEGRDGFLRDYNWKT